jgi:hypothetical protein
VKTMSWDDQAKRVEIYSRSTGATIYAGTCDSFEAAHALSAAFAMEYGNGLQRGKEVVWERLSKVVEVEFGL